MRSSWAVATSTLSVALLLVAWPAAAQTKAAEPNPAPPQEDSTGEVDASEPSAEDDSEDAEATDDAEYAPDDEATAEDDSAVQESAAPSAASQAARHSLVAPQSSDGFLRVLTEAGFGAVGAAIGLALGSIAGSIVALPFMGLGQYAFYVAYFGGGGLGAATVIALSVWAAGSLWDAEGRFLATALGTVIGGAIGIAIFMSMISSYGSPWPLAFLAPILGGIIGYEVSNAFSVPRGLPMIAPFWTRGGGGLALAWEI